MTIWANCIVHNEENFIWFALMSVVDYVDKILVWDTGSTDRTVEIIKEVIKKKGEKIVFKKVGKVDELEFTMMRQRMLEQSKCDWVLILDGDEIWWEDSIKKIVEEINNKRTEIEGIVVPMVVPVGDIYHLQEELAGQYRILGRKGHLNLRAINRKIPGLHVDWPYGKESYLDGSKKLIQEKEKIIYVDTPYLHVTHLKRSSKQRKYDKYKLELGKQFPKEFKYPESFYSQYPDYIQNPWRKMSFFDYIIAFLLTPLRNVKRFVFARL